MHTDLVSDMFDSATMESKLTNNEYLTEAAYTLGHKGPFIAYRTKVIDENFSHDPRDNYEILKTFFSEDVETTQDPDVHSYSPEVLQDLYELGWEPL